MEAYKARGHEYVVGRASNPVKTKVVYRDPYPNLFPGFGDSLKTFVGTKVTMPRRARTKTSTKRRRRIYRKRPPATLQPYSIVRKLKTAFQYTLNPGAGTMSIVKLKLNSAYDPSGDVGAGQPLGFDQYNTLYKRYCVTKCSLHFKAVSADNTNAVAVGFTPKTDDTSLSTYLHYVEIPGTVSRHMTPDIDKIEYGSKVNIKPYVLPRGGKMLGDDTVCALYSSDPSKILYGHLWSMAMDTAADPSTILITGVMYQTVVFFDPIIPARS